MTKGMFGAVVLTALLAALGVSALAMYIAPRAMQPQPAMGNMQPAFYTGAQPGYYVQPQSAQPMYGQPVVYAQPMPQYTQQPIVYLQPVRRTAPAVRRVASTTAYEPRAEVRQKRSTQKSVLIVAGSAGAGAAIGGLTGGKKGAAIGAISGGVAGLVYDRLTANPK